MQILHLGTKNGPQLTVPTALTIGNFDGVHVGHQKLIRALVGHAHRLGLRSLVLTFDPHPASLLKKIQMKPICSASDKAAFIQSLGVQYLVVQEFSQEFSEQSAEDFLRQYLLPQFNPNFILFGYDFRFGRKGEGDFDFLSRCLKDEDMLMESFHPESLGEEVISSSKIRSALEAGDVDRVRHFLGRSHSISGQVVSGEKLGRRLGFPTANLNSVEQFLPAHGVYYGYARIAGKDHRALLNIGTRPSVSAHESTQIECHILDFSDDIYGKELSFVFEGRLRDEMKFSNLSCLQKQIVQDCEDAKVRFIEGEKS